MHFKFSSARVSVALQTSTCLSSHKHFLEIATTTIHNGKKEINTNYISAIECYNQGCQMKKILSAKISTKISQFSAKLKCEKATFRPNIITAKR